jgi:TRAP-type C4-dicarboxylate transport system substrate-binding protein
MTFALLLIGTGCGQAMESSAPAAAGGQPSGGQGQTEMTVRIAYNLPAEHSTGVYFEVLAKEIEKHTANTSIRLHPQTFPNAQLYNDQQLPDAVSTGAVEIGQLNVGFLAGQEAEPLRIIDLPFLYQSWEAEWEAEDGEFGTLFGQQLEKFNMKMIGWAQYGTVDLYANKSIKLPSDLQGLKMRGFGKGSSLMLQELGASPVSMSSQEIYQAMQHGTIDGYSTGPSSVVDRGLFEVTKHGTNMNMSFLPFQGIANKTWWDSLPADVQKAIADASQVAQKASREKARADAEEYLKKLAEHGVELYKPTPEERNQWVEAANGRFEDYRQKSGDLGKQLWEAVQKANQNHPAK